MADVGIANSMRFLFCCGSGMTTKRCCCGCSLRLGTQIICVLSIISGLGSLITWASVFLPPVVEAIAIIYQVVQFVGPVLVFISTFNNNFKLAYYGRLMIEIFALLWLSLGFLFGLLWGLVFYRSNTYHNGEIYYYNAGAAFWFVYFFSWGLGATISLYFAYVIFSFTKELGSGNMSLLDGVEHTHQVTPHNNYSPPLISQSPNTVVQPGQPYYSGYSQPVNQVNQFSTVPVQPYQVQPVHNNNQVTLPITQSIEPQVNQVNPRNTPQDYQQ